MAVFNDDHRTVVQIRYALIFFLSSLYDIDFHLLSGNTCRFQRVGQIVDIQDDDALQGSYLIEIVIVRYDLGVDLTAQPHELGVDALDIFKISRPRRPLFRLSKSDESAIS